MLPKDCLDLVRVKAAMKLLRPDCLVRIEMALCCLVDFSSSVMLCLLTFSLSEASWSFVVFVKSNGLDTMAFRSMCSVLVLLLESADSMLLCDVRTIPISLSSARSCSDVAYLSSQYHSESSYYGCVNEMNSAIEHLRIRQILHLTNDQARHLLNQRVPASLLEHQAVMRCHGRSCLSSTS